MMSRQRFKLNQLVHLHYRSRYYVCNGIGVVTGYTSGEYAPYLVRLLATDTAGVSHHYYYGSNPYRRDNLFNCIPSELQPMLNEIDMNNPHIALMGSSIASLIRSGTITKKNAMDKTYSRDHYVKQHKSLMGRLLWVTFAYNRIKNLRVRKPLGGNHLYVDTSTFTPFPIEHEQERNNYVH
jgi:hypothetical protein